MIHSIIDSWFNEIMFGKYCILIGIIFFIVCVVILIDFSLDKVNVSIGDVREIKNKNKFEIGLLHRKLREVTEELKNVKKLNNGLIENEMKYDALRIGQVTIAAYSPSEERYNDDLLIGAIGIKIINK